MELLIPLKEKVEKFLFAKGIVVQTANGKLKPAHRSHLLNFSDREIVERYNAEIRGICNYYRLAVNYYKLNYFCYLMEYSCLKTLAGKYKSSVSKMWNKYRHGKSWSIPYKTKTESKYVGIVKAADCKNGKVCDTIPPINQITSRITIHARLEPRVCELCATRSEEPCEIHHVGSLEKLGNSVWEMVMKKKRRKTLVVCSNCHSNVIHG